MQAGKTLHHRVREALAVDWQSHGEAGVLNRDLLPEDGVCASSLHSYFPFTDWMRRAQRRLNGATQSQHSSAPHIFLGRRIVGIGHSGGAGTLHCAVTQISPRIPFHIPHPHRANHGHPCALRSHHGAAHPRHRQRDAPQARYMVEPRGGCRAREPWRRWNKTVFALFIEHGLVPTTGSGEATLKCDRRHEARGMADVEPHMAAVEVLGRIGGRMPVHLVWANGSELMYVPCILLLFPSLPIMRYTFSFSYYASPREANPDTAREECKTRSQRSPMSTQTGTKRRTVAASRRLRGLRAGIECVSPLFLPSFWHAFASFRLEFDSYWPTARRVLQIVQESPDDVARAICCTLDSISVTDGGEQSRL
ncbi:hypothetical protein MSAN_01126000 [Mycena sanguinolenta]|uniref:Uncharacterized protein n=1 Tax=Mycena sanguinolenta TaxID=230812 RepID=A0A8H6YL04_9AGAR|nr:hypothetical protein MSAN_01126000 [Mycena sanguinolenta]